MGKLFVICMNTTQKVLVFGFPHCGTSILKSIIGHIEDVEEIYEEIVSIDKKSDKKFILGKYPWTIDDFFGKKYEDYIKIFLTRSIFVTYKFTKNLKCLK